MFARCLRSFLPALICLTGLLACQSGTQRPTTIVLELDTADPDVRRTVAGIIEDRLVHFGHEGLAVTTEGKDRILIAVPDDADIKRLVDLATRTATLDFRFVCPPERWQPAIAAVDEALRGEHGTEQPFSSLLVFTQPSSSGPGVFVPDPNRDAVGRLLAGAPARVALAGVDAVLWSSCEPATSDEQSPMHSLHLLETESVLTGRDILEASPRPDVNRPGNWVISIELTGLGGRKFARTTGDNVGRFLAICLDGEVYSAPRINGAIPGGSAVIEGMFTEAQARDLAVALQSGSLPAAVTLVEVIRGGR